ncbi:MAG: (2Fe-2S)-binding protein [Haloechinothrix sp.]
MRIRRSADIARRLAAHGLSESIRRINERQHQFHIEFGSPPGCADEPRGWRGCADLLADPNHFIGWRKTLAEWLHGQYGTAPDRTTAGYVQTWYLQAPAFIGALLFHHERRVPSLRPEHIAFRIAIHDRPHLDGLALAATEFACLPGDPAAGAPEATVVESEHALAGLLRARYAAHAARFVRAYGPTVRFGRHTLWAAATDSLDVALWRAGSYLGDEGGGVADAALVLPDTIEPFTSASTLRSACDEHGNPTWTRRKESCCFHYLLTQGDSECATCPRRSPRHAR